MTKLSERAGLPSASSFRRYELCNGSYQLECEARELGQEAHKESEAAERGTRIHAYLAGVLDEDGKEIVLTESEQLSADFLQERAQEQAQRIFGDAQTRALAEKRLWLTLHGNRVLSGQFDRVIYTDSTALVQDFKTGFSEPDPAEQNAQLKVLAVLVGMHLPGVREVIVQIISGPYGVTEARYDLAALGAAYHDIRVTLGKIQAADAPLTPSPEACKWCPAINICQAVRNLSQPLAKLQVSRLPDGGPRAAKLLDEISVLRGLFDQVEDFYSEKLLADPAYELPGYAMVPGNIRREVTNWETAHARLGEYLDSADLWGAASYRLGDIEKALARKMKIKASAAKERVNEILGGLIAEKQNAPSLKRVKGEPAKLATLSLP